MDHAKGKAPARGVRGGLSSPALTTALFAAYAVVLVWAILFKLQFPSDMLGVMRSVSLVPFAGVTVINGAADYREVVLNVLAFVPFGLFASMLFPRRPLGAKLAAAALASLGLEILQFVLALGASDTTDVLANTAGAALGLGAYALVRKAAGSDERALRVCNLAALALALLAAALLLLLLAANR